MNDILDKKSKPELIQEINLLHEKLATLEKHDVERQQMRESMRISELKLQSATSFLYSIVNTLPEPIFVKDEQHRWIVLNEAFCKFIGYDMDDMLGKSDYDFFPKEQADIFWETDRLVFDTEQPNENEEVVTNIAQGQTYIISTKKSVFTQPDGQKILVGVIRNITASKQTEQSLKQHQEELEARVEERTRELSQANAFLENQIQERIRTEIALQESESRFRRLFESNLVGIMFWNINGPILDANDAFLSIIGYSQEDLKAQRLYWTALTPPDIKEVDQKALHELATRGVFMPYEKEYICKDNRRVPILLGGTFLENSQENGVAFVLDISERKQAEKEIAQSREQLRKLFAHSQSVREEERTRISRELHDELGQVLTALSLDIRWLQEHLTKGDPESLMKKTVLMAKLVDSIIESVRELVADLRPSVLDNLGLLPAIEWFLRSLQQRTKIRYSLKKPSQALAISKDKATALFRIFQEAMTNIARHSQASYAEISLEIKGVNILLTIKDNGVGIKDHLLNNVSSMGILGIRERALMMEGTATINSSNGKGTKVQVRVPKN